MNSTKKQKLLSQFIRIKSKSTLYKIVVQYENGVQLGYDFYSIEDILKAIQIVNPGYRL